MDEDNKYYYFHRHYKGHKSFAPLLLIFIGVLFLLNNYGVLPWSAWRYFFRLWPLLLIILGIRMVLGQNRASYIISTLITLIILALALAFALAPTNPAISQYLNQYLPGLQQRMNIPDNNQNQNFNSSPDTNGNNFYSY